MPEPDWSVWVHDQQTGAPLQRVQVEGDAPFSASLSGDGESEVTIVTNDAAHPWTQGQIADAFAPNARMLVRWWGVNGGGHADDIPMTAHKIESYDYDRDAGKVNVKAVDALDFAEWRLVDGVGADPRSTLTITNRSASGAVRAALGRMMQWNPDWALPVDLPDDGAGDFSGAWPFWEGHLISDVLQAIRERMGVEIYLDPYATPDGGVRFRTLVGKPISIGGAHFHLDAARSPLSAVVYRVNGANQVTGIQGIGQGTGEDQQTRASKGVVKIPIRDSRKTFPDMVGDELQQAADTYYAQNVDPVVQWDIGSFTIDADFGPELVRPGRQLSLEVRGDVVIPDGVYTVRVVKVSGGAGRVLKPEVQ